MILWVPEPEEKLYEIQIAHRTKRIPNFPQAQNENDSKTKSSEQITLFSPIASFKDLSVTFEFALLIGSRFDFECYGVVSRSENSQNMIPGRTRK